MTSSHTPQSVGKYQIKALIKQGNITDVYRAFDTVIEREVAIKMIQQQLLDSESADTLCKHFAIYLKAAAQCQQVNVISIYDYAVHERCPYMVMEYISGGNVEDLLKKQQLNQEQSVKLILKVLEALHDLHQQGVIHSGIKPSTILLPSAFLANFAVNLYAIKITAFAMTIMNADNSSIAPELRNGGNISVRSDLYAVATVLLQLLLQRPLLVNALNDEAVQQVLTSKNIADELVGIVSQGLHSKLHQRYYDAMEFHQALTNYLSHQSNKAVVRPEPVVVPIPQANKPSEQEKIVLHNEAALQREMTLLKESALQREWELEAALRSKEAEWQTRLLVQQRTAAQNEASLQEELALYKEATSKHKEDFRKTIGQYTVKSSRSFWREFLVISGLLVGGWLFMYGQDEENLPAATQKIKFHKATVRGNNAENQAQNEENSTQTSEETVNIDSRYRINKDVVEDLNTGLFWMRCSLGQKWDGMQCAGDAKGYSLEQVTYLAQTSKADGWRLPTREELLTLVYCNEFESSLTDNEGCGAAYHVMPTILDNVFPKTPSFSFWSHSPNATEYGIWGAVEFVNGSYNEVTKNEVFYVRMLRKEP